MGQHGGGRGRVTHRLDARPSSHAADAVGIAGPEARLFSRGLPAGQRFRRGDPGDNGVCELAPTGTHEPYQAVLEATVQLTAAAVLGYEGHEGGEHGRHDCAIIAKIGAPEQCATFETCARLP